MKVLIVFLAMLVINTSFIVHQGDLNRYVRLQTFLKAVCEEAAAGASLYYDEESYSHGLMVINQEEGRKYIDYLVSQAEQSLGIGDMESLAAEIQIVDDMGDALGAGTSPSVTVTLYLNVEKLFRLPFINRKQVVRSARYELVDYQPR
jgi:mevalonate kinase